MAVASAGVVRYRLRLGEAEIDLNECIGKPLTLLFEHEIRCTVCGKVTPKSYGQGFCYPCFASAPENSECIIRPELCRGHLGGGRDAEWERIHHVQEHVVYVALTSGAKIGVTRATQIPARWIDQGAVRGVILARTPYRQLAGAIEVVAKPLIADRTNWRRMLTNKIDGVDIVAEKHRIAGALGPALAAYVVPDDEETVIHYPVERYPEKVRSVRFDKEERISGVLLGIKGQYLLFEGDRVLNVRRHTGYVVSVSTECIRSATAAPA